jgi:hypothetical protein
LDTGDARIVETAEEGLPKARALLRAAAMAVLSRRPLAWGGLFCLVGVALPERAAEPVAPTAIAIVALVGLARFAPARAARRARSSSDTRRESPDPKRRRSDDREAIQGTVSRTAGNRVLVELAKGRVTFLGRPIRCPRPATPVAARFVRRSRRRRSRAIRRRSSSTTIWAGRLKALRSRRASCATLPPAADTWLDGAVHRGLLRAFVTGDRREVTEAETALLRDTGTSISFR